MNQKSEAEVREILELYREGWGCRTISRKVGISRQTVQKIVQGRHAHNSTSIVDSSRSGWDYVNARIKAGIIKKGQHKTE